ncbi:PAS domain-containing sensor histidine kinase [Uliginosibacterium sp. H3]|uniref:PAS domain-containing sensor histidine kinase n=1 Tax=Uliginosibacterium silvisoli TaxID=3114758 RepID=A0ABU6K1F2_9RHOO|nr:PAS domain-containing sensor histidine kinase [Uliginosibacterium sp. H3]
MDKFDQQKLNLLVSGVLESAMDAIVAVDARQRIVIYNKAAELVFLHPRESAMGQPLDLLIPRRFHATHSGHVERFGKTGATTRRMGGPMVLYGLRANGEEFPVEASIAHSGEGEEKLYTVILRDVTERVHAEAALRQSKEELRELAALAQSVREQEKSRIARELHDELGQSLTALKMDVIALRHEVPAESHHMAERIARIESMLNQTVAATRRISADLRPLMLDDLGLAAAVEWVIQEFTQRSSAECDVVIQGELDLEDPYATAVFRVLQESLTNIAKHANASRVDVLIERGADKVHLRVQDNGSGFSLESPRKRNSHGLLGVRERAYLLGGQSQISSTPGLGTIVELWLPLGEEA